MSNTKESLNNLKLGISQMPVVVGRPDLNVQYILKEVAEAKENGVDIIIFPELCVTGYVIGDMFEREDFIRDANKLCDAGLIEASRDGITVIVGLPVYDE